MSAVDIVEGIGTCAVMFGVIFGAARLSRWIDRRAEQRRAALAEDLRAAGERHPAGKKPTLAERQDDRLDPYGPALVPYTIASGGREGWLSPDEADEFAALVAEFQRDGAR